MNPEHQPPEPKPSEKFKAAMKQILSVPKAEIDRREEEYQKQRAAKMKGERRNV